MNNLFPLELIKSGVAKKIKVLLKDGRKIEGILNNMDRFMNLEIIKGKIFFPKKFEKFEKIEKIFIRGNSIKNLQLTSEALIENQKTMEIKRKAFKRRFHNKSNTHYRKKFKKE